MKKRTKTVVFKSALYLVASIIVFVAAHQVDYIISGDVAMISFWATMLMLLAGLFIILSLGSVVDHFRSGKTDE